MAKIPNFANIPFAGAEANEQAAQEWLTQLKAETGKSFDENFYRTMEQIDVAPLYDQGAYAASVAHRYPELDAFEDYHGDRSCAFALQYTASSGNLVHENQESYIKEYACRTYADILY